ncbi:hypothetical protein [Streptomyces sp. NPDC050485]|uniref:hypothetical protein n=1 Tax=Streptomyces sp. NPDC050485 TaxID=3365617 RepID=UPI003787F5F3
MDKVLPDSGTLPLDPAVYFDDHEAAYDALLDWWLDRIDSDRRRDALVRGALRVFPAHGGVTKVHRATRLARSTIERIEAAGVGVPAVTEGHFPDILGYADVLDVLASRSGAEARRCKGDRAEELRLEQMVLQGLAARLRDCPGDDVGLQALAARLHWEAEDMRRGTVDTYDGPLRVSHAPNHVTVHCLEMVAGQLTQLRLRGDAAFEDLAPELVAEAQQRAKENQDRDVGELMGGVRYFTALREGRSVHGSREADRAAGRVITLAQRKKELEREIAELTDTALDQISEEADPSTLRPTAAQDQEVRLALITVLGEQGAADFLASSGQGE